MLGVKYRNKKKAGLLKPDKVYELNIDLWSTSIVFNKGHKIKLYISNSNYPRFSVDLNTGEDYPADIKTINYLFSKAKGLKWLPVNPEKKWVKTINKFYYGDKYNSRLVLPAVNFVGPQINK